jgi:hypothetical protein
MIVEDRLREAGDEARRVAESFAAPGVQRGLGLRWHRRLAAGIAVAAVVIAVAVAGVWGIADLMVNETEPAKPGPGPELQWTRVTNPPGVERVLDVWTTDDGFALWSASESGGEVWTSPDGQAWQLATTTPEGVFSYDTHHALEHFNGTWLGIDSAADTPSVMTNVSGQWTEVALPYSFEPGNDLLTAITYSALIAANDADVVVVGRATMIPDSEAVMAQFAPEIAQAGGTASLNLDDRTVDIADGSRTVVSSIPFDEIDERFSQLGPVQATVVWHSNDGINWQQVDSAEQMPMDLGADNTGFVMLSGKGTDIDVGNVWSSRDGVQWDSTSLISPTFENSGLALHAGQIIVAHSDSLIAFDRQGRTKTVSVGDAFTDLDPDLRMGPRVDSGPYGIVASAYDGSTDSTPVVALWYSPDGTHWSRQDVADIFGGQGSIEATVGTDRVLVAHDPNNAEADIVGSNYELWIGTVP